MHVKLAKAFGIAPSTSYYQQRLPGKDEVLLSRIKAVMADNPAYGHERVAMALGEGKERVRRVMKANSLRPAIRRAKPWAKLKTGGITAELQNLIWDTAPTKPSHIWASDFTYLWFNGQWIYLAAVLDIFTREIVGWQLGRRSKAQLIHLAYCDALSNHTPPAIFMPTKAVNIPPQVPNS